MLPLRFIFLSLIFLSDVFLRMVGLQAKTVLGAFVVNSLPPRVAVRSVLH